MTDFVINISEDPLVQDLRQLIEEMRSMVAVTVNATLGLLYWKIGSRISVEI